MTAERVAATLTPEDVDRLEIEAIGNAFAGKEVSGSREHMLRIAAELAPDPRHFRYAGERIDYGPNYLQDDEAVCACSARIRYAFPVVRDSDGKTVNVGSTCIGSSVQFLTTSGADILADDLVAAYERHMAAIAEAERNARDERNQTVVEALQQDYEPAQAWLVNAREAARETLKYRYRIDEALPPLVQPQTASTPGRTAASLRKRYVSWWTKRAHSGYLPPVPNDPQMRDRIYADAVDTAGRARWSLQRYEESNAEQLAAAEPRYWIVSRHKERIAAVEQSEATVIAIENHYRASGHPIPDLAPSVDASPTGEPPA